MIQAVQAPLHTASTPDSAALNLFVLGSCRVHRPVKLLQESGSARLHTSGVSGYIHSTREAAQRVRWLAERTGLDRQLLPFLFPAARVPIVTPALADELRTADLLVVEAAAERSVSVDGVFLQKNLVVRHLVRELGDEGMAWWRSLVRNGRVLPEAYDAVRPVFEHVIDDALKPAGERVLRGAVCAEDTEADVRADLHYLARVVDKPLLAVTHVDVARPDGRRMVSRSRHVERVKTAAEGVHGVEVMDPLEIAQGWDEAALLDKDGADVNHYSPRFEAVLAEHMLDRVRAQLRRSGPARAARHSFSLPE